MNGRQTLGSNHEGPTHGSSDSGHAANERFAPDTTLPIWWRMFADQIATLGEDQRRVADAMVAHVTAGWKQVIQLQDGCARVHDARGLDPDRRVILLIEHIEREVAAPFILCARQTMRYLSETEGSASALDGLRESMASFDRANAVCALASESVYLADPLRATVAQAANALLDWSTEYEVLAAAMARVGSGTIDRGTDRQRDIPEGRREPT